MGEAIRGCTDRNAKNYDPLANIDDGSCEMPEDVVDMTPFPFGMDVKDLDLDNMDDLELTVAASRYNMTLEELFKY